ncbi:hypothetical protein GCM10022212_31100 [Actimicrobium antarcticum]|uniref:Uncharacterized protein n=1 Tax=Actimicrobium antarcticum TaxID=1051899 RepID=A0ABP7TS84_9BURK
MIGTAGTAGTAGTGQRSMQRLHCLPGLLVTLRGDSLQALPLLRCEEKLIQVTGAGQRPR